MPPKPLTLDEFLAQPETVPAREYARGQIVQKPARQTQHRPLLARLAAAINTVGRPGQSALALPDLRCTFGGRSLVPDLSVFAWSRRPLAEAGALASASPLPPDWAIDLLSVNQDPCRITTNLLHGFRFGCQLGWLLNPLERMVLVYPAGRSPVVFDRARQVLPVPAFVAELRLTVGDLFRDRQPG